MPYFKKEHHVKDAINSVLFQSYQNIELIIIYDDEDKSDLNYLNHIVKNNSKIKIIENQKNIGAGLSRNKGIKHAKGDLIAFIDADDFWYKDKLEKQLSFMNKNNYEFVFCDYIKKKDDNEKKVLCKFSSLNYYELLNSCDIGLSTVLIKKKIIEENLFPALKTKEDYVVWLNVTKKNTKAFKLDEILVVWNDVKNSLSSNIFQKIIDGYKVYRTYQNFSLIKSFYYLIKLSINSIGK